MSIDTLSIPSTYARLIIERCQARGIAIDAAARQLDQRKLEDPDGRLRLLDVGALLYQAFLGDEAIGYEIGLSTQLTTHGFVGYGVLTYPRVRDALEFGMRYAALRTPFVAMRMHTEAGVVYIDVEETFALGPARRVCMEHFLIGIWRIAQLLGQASGVDDLGCSLHFDFPEPDCHARYRERLPPCHFSATANQLRFPAAYLDLPLATADGTAARVATEYCENERRRHAVSGSTLTARVSAILAAAVAPPALAPVATQLHLSPRSLKRKLKAEQTSFQSLVDGHCERYARQRLRSPQPSIARIAEELGYTTTANFTRAFRRWTGSTPTQVRQNYRTGSANAE